MSFATLRTMRSRFPASNLLHSFLSPVLGSPSPRSPPLQEDGSSPYQKARHCNESQVTGVAVGVSVEMPDEELQEEDELLTQELDDDNPAAKRKTEVEGPIPVLDEQQEELPARNSNDSSPFEKTQALFDGLTCESAPTSRSNRDDTVSPGHAVDEKEVDESALAVGSTSNRGALMTPAIGPRTHIRRRSWSPEPHCFRNSSYDPPLTLFAEPEIADGGLIPRETSVLGTTHAQGNSTWTTDEVLEPETDGQTQSETSSSRFSRGSKSPSKDRRSSIFSLGRGSSVANTAQKAMTEPRSMVNKESRLTFSASAVILYCWNYGADSQFLVRMRFTQDLGSVKVRGQCLPLFAGEEKCQLDLRHVSGGDLSGAAFGIHSSSGKWLLHYDEEGNCASVAFDVESGTAKALAVSRDDKTIAVATEAATYVYTREGSHLHHVATIRIEYENPKYRRIPAVGFSLDSTEVLLGTQVCRSNELQRHPLYATSYKLENTYGTTPKEKRLNPPVIAEVTPQPQQTSWAIFPAPSGRQPPFMFRSQVSSLSSAVLSPPCYPCSPGKPSNMIQGPVQVSAEGYTQTFIHQNGREVRWYRVDSKEERTLHKITSSRNCPDKNFPMGLGFAKMDTAKLVRAAWVGNGQPLMKEFAWGEQQPGRMKEYKLGTVYDNALRKSGIRL